MSVKKMKERCCQVTNSKPTSWLVIDQCRNNSTSQSTMMYSGGPRSDTALCFDKPRATETAIQRPSTHRHHHIASTEKGSRPSSRRSTAEAELPSNNGTSSWESYAAWQGPVATAVQRPSTHRHHHIASMEKGSRPSSRRSTAEAELPSNNGTSSWES
jgi:hypothetical protein